MKTQVSPLLSSTQCRSGRLPIAFPQSYLRWLDVLVAESLVIDPLAPNSPSWKFQAQKHQVMSCPRQHFLALFVALFLALFLETARRETHRGPTLLNPFGDGRPANRGWTLNPSILGSLWYPISVCVGRLRSKRL